jgi:hypothetical protein
MSGEVVINANGFPTLSDKNLAFILFAIKRLPPLRRCWVQVLVTALDGQKRLASLLGPSAPIPAFVVPFRVARKRVPNMSPTVMYLCHGTTHNYGAIDVGSAADPLFINDYFG